MIPSPWKRFSFLPGLFLLALGEQWWTPEESQFDETLNDAEVDVATVGFGDMTTMAANVIDFYKNPHSERNTHFDFDRIFQKYFPLEQKEDVIKVYERFQAKDEHGKFVMSHAHFSGKDPWEICKAKETDVAATIAYVWNSYLPGQPKYGAMDRNQPGRMYFCVGENADFFLMPFLDDKRCPPSSPLGYGVDEELDPLDTWVSNAMLTFGHYGLHESLHLHEVSYEIFPRGPNNEDRIVDLKLDGNYAFGPLGTKALASGEQKSQAKYNADSYAWLATEVYWTLKCQMYFDEARNNARRPVLKSVDDGSCDSDEEMGEGSSGDDNISDKDKPISDGDFEM